MQSATQRMWLCCYIRDVHAEMLQTRRTFRERERERWWWCRSTSQNLPSFNTTTTLSSHFRTDYYCTRDGELRMRSTSTFTQLLTWTYVDIGPCEPVWPSGKALGKRKDLGSTDTASALLSLQKGCDLWTLSCDFVHHFLLKH